MRYVFFDPVCPSPYSTRTREESALAGTEATVTRIADALDASVIQHNRTESEGHYLSANADISDVTHLVLLRDPRRLKALYVKYPTARLYLWVHDLVYPGSKHGKRLASQAEVLRGINLTLVCVSDTQRLGVEAVLRQMHGCEHVQACTVYNPIDDALSPDGSDFDFTKLVFFSSPHKGLAYALDAFGVLRKRMPDLRLCVGNPGYKPLRKRDVEGVEWLGALPHHQMLAEARTALCVFYPNFVVPETFGLVLAEANAVGTPVLTHACGAAPEVIGDSRQLLPVEPSQEAYVHMARYVPAGLRPAVARWAGKQNLFEPYIERIRAWRNGERPRTGPDSRFRLSVVTERWHALFADQLSGA
jgi:glycosyltransferase involved in cell wall biosynthesis